MSSSLKIDSFPTGSFQCNCSIIYSPDTLEAVVIDCGNDFEFFEKKVQKLGVTVKYLLHTHAHFDHIGQADTARKKWQTPIYLHKEDLFLYQNLKQQAVIFGEEVAEPNKIDYFIEDEQEFSLNFLESDISAPKLKKFLKAIHTPGHTPGSLSFYSESFDQPILFSGDTLFSRSIGRTDLPGGNSEQILSSINRRILTLPDETRCITGHGPDTSIYEERKMNPFLT